MLNIVCLKWGTKYGPEYVNRLYSMCKKFYTNPFKFYCATDDSNGIRHEVKILDLEKFQVPDGKWGGKVFTAEKIKLINHFDSKTLLLDLDILILDDITSYVDGIELHDKPYFIRNTWADQDNIKQNYGKITCDVNSSFVIGDKGSIEVLRHQLFHISQHDKYNYYALKYKSLDKTIYYRFQWAVNFHEDKKLVYSFNGGASWPDDMERGKYRPDYKVCLFNNSHGEGDDIHDSNASWAIEYWESFND